MGNSADHRLLVSILHQLVPIPPVCGTDHVLKDLKVAIRGLRPIPAGPDFQGAGLGYWLAFNILEKGVPLYVAQDLERLCKRTLSIPFDKPGRYFRQGEQPARCTGGIGW